MTDQPNVETLGPIGLLITFDQAVDSWRSALDHGLIYYVRLHGCMPPFVYTSTRVKADILPRWIETRQVKTLLENQIWLPCPPDE